MSVLPPKPLEPVGHDPTEPVVHLSRRTCQILVAVFLGFLVLPPLILNVTRAFQKDGWVPVVEVFNVNSPDAQNRLALKKESNPNIKRTKPDFVDHREAFEENLDDAAYVEKPRQWLQSALVPALREGNRRTVIGQDGWLYFRPEIHAVTGFGPLKAEPNSVAKDPTRLPWAGPHDVIQEFAAQLQAAGVELFLVPIPSKPMIEPEFLTGRKLDHPLTHPDAEAFYESLRRDGVRVLEPSDLFMGLKQKGAPVFLKQDTHWTPETMSETARYVAEELKKRPWFAGVPGTLKATLHPKPAAALGDLVEKLDLPASLSPYREEQVTIQEVIDDATQKPVLITDKASPVVLLGDSFVNIYSSSVLGWGENAGFAQHLARHLGMTLDTIAQNGQGSTGVRRTLASRPGALEGKKAVIWAIASRDLLLGETLARETGVEWNTVTFNAQKPATPIAGALVIEATLLARSSVPNPATASYPDALFAARYQVEKVVQGQFADAEIYVVHPGYWKKQLTPEAALKPGDRKVLTLVPFESKRDLQSLYLSDDLEAYLQTLYWAAEPPK